MKASVYYGKRDIRIEKVPHSRLVRRARVRRPWPEFLREGRRPRAYQDSSPAFRNRPHPPFRRLRWHSKGPNFSRLVEWAKDALNDVPPRHVLLCREEELATVRADLASAPWLQPLVYGKDYEEVTAFLRSLAPPAGTAVSGLAGGAALPSEKRRRLREIADRVAREEPLRGEDESFLNVDIPSEISAQFWQLASDIPDRNAFVKAIERLTIQLI
jgi:hypothetical protein